MPLRHPRIRLRKGSDFDHTNPHQQREDCPTTQNCHGFSMYGDNCPVTNITDLDALSATNTRRHPYWNADPVDELASGRFKPLPPGTKPRLGDKVTWWNDRNRNSNIDAGAIIRDPAGRPVSVNPAELEHSGVVTGLRGHHVDVTSKWGSGDLMRHDVNDTPYQGTQIIYWRK
jgi:hypothetical protein